MMKSYLDYTPQDMESHFILALASAQRQQFDLAQQSVQAVLDLGRTRRAIYTGPRRLIQPLFDHYTDLRLQLLSKLETVASDNSADDPKTSIIHGPMISSVTDKSAKIWCRPTNEGMVELRLLDRRYNQFISRITDPNS